MQRFLRCSLVVALGLLIAASAFAATELDKKIVAETQPPAPSQAARVLTSASARKAAAACVQGRAHRAERRGSGCRRRWYGFGKGCGGVDLRARISRNPQTAIPTDAS